jgi:pyrimidine operon attenuation protein/uracil phosphoribosyltransferase
MQPRVIADPQQISLILHRLCFELIENHSPFHNSVIIGVQPRGIQMATRIASILSELRPHEPVPFGKLDITFYRDDFRLKNSMPTASETDMPFSVEGKRVILIDDVLFTGRTIRSALDALLDFGRPEEVELLVLIDRRLHRDVPIQARYVGKVVDSITEEKVKVEWKESDGEDRVWVVRDEKNKTTAP